MKYRLQRVALAFAALAVAAALAAVLFSVYGTAERRLGGEFAVYGANLLATPKTGDSVKLVVAEAARKLGVEAAPFAIGSTRIGTEDVPLAGFDPAVTEPLTRYWHVDGTRTISDGECLAGEVVASRFGLKPGDSVPFGDGTCLLKGILSTGGVEDREVLARFDRVAKRPGEATFIEMRAAADKLESVRAALVAQFPDIDFRANLALAGTETGVLLRMRAALILLTLLILGITTLCVTGNFAEMVLERAKEIAIMKSIGAGERPIASFFVAESALLALGATLAGYGAGVLISAAVTRGIFGGVYRIEAGWPAFGGVALTMLVIAAVSTAIATARIRSIEPARLLRGE